MCIFSIIIHPLLKFFPSGVFLIPYALFLFTCGIPIFFVEVSVGQLTSQGGITCWKQMSPALGGAANSIINYQLSIINCFCSIWNIFNIISVFPPLKFDHIFVHTGLGYSGELIMFYTAMYYIVVLAWSFLYFFSSFHTVLPWATCNNTWNTGTHLNYDNKRKSIYLPTNWPTDFNVYGLPSFKLQSWLYINMVIISKNFLSNWFLFYSPTSR